MPSKKSKTSEVEKVFNAIWNVIKIIFIAVWKVLVQIFVWIKYILIIIERSAKTIAIFIVSIAFFILALATSFYLFSSTFGIKDSPAFQELRDKVAAIYVLNIEDIPQDDTCQTGEAKEDGSVEEAIEDNQG